MASVWNELKRRNVVRVAAAYAVIAWLLLQVADVVLNNIEAPTWVFQTILLLLVIGFPLALIFAWAFELTPEGIKKEKDVDRSESVTHLTGRKLDFAIMGLMGGAILFLVVNNYVLDQAPPETADEDAVPAFAISEEEQRGAMPNSVAVLPFDNLSPNPDDAYFAAGLHDELLNQLAKLRNLSVISRTSVLRYADSDLSIPEIAGELNVATVMEGSVRYANDRVRITAQLIDAETDEHLWSETYDREFSDIFAIESDIAMNIANALEAEFSLEEQEQIERPPTESPDAYKLYLKGRYFWNIRTEEAIQNALNYFQQAVELDPGYAFAYSGMGDVWIFRGWYSILPAMETFPKAIEAITKALAFDETLAEAHASRAQIYLEFDYDWPAAESGYLRAIELNPKYPTAHQWYGGYLSAMGRHDEALMQAHEARELNPLSLIIITWVGLRHYFAGRYTMAIQEYEKALELNPDFAPAHWHLGWAYEQTGSYAAAIASAERAFAKSGNPIYLASLGHAHAKAGDDDEARKILARLEQIAMTRHVSAYHTAVIYIALGDVDEGIRWLERAYAERSPWIGYMRVDPRLDPLRSDSRFDALLRQARLN